MLASLNRLSSIQDRVDFLKKYPNQSNEYMKHAAKILEDDGFRGTWSFRCCGNGLACSSNSCKWRIYILKIYILFILKPLPTIL
jgi:hypothetical protein